MDKISLKEVKNKIIKESIQIGEIDGKKIIFNPNISCTKMFTVCEQIVNNTLLPDGTYLPELKKLLIFYFMVENATNIPIKKDNENIDIDYLYSLMTSEIGKSLENKFLLEPTYNFLLSQTEEQINIKKQIQQEILKFKNIDNLIEIIYSAINKFSSFTDECKNFISGDTLKNINNFVENSSNNQAN